MADNSYTAQDILSITATISISRDAFEENVIDTKGLLQ